METSEIFNLAKQLDKIITSDRKEVTDAFRELLIVSTLTDGSGVTGPLEQLLNDVNRLRKEVHSLHYALERYDSRFRGQAEWESGPSAGKTARIADHNNDMLNDMFNDYRDHFHSWGGKK